MIEQIQHHFHQGELYYSQHHFAAAIQSFEHCTRLMPQLIEAWENVAVCLAALGQNRESIEHFLFSKTDAALHPRLTAKLNTLVFRDSKAVDYMSQLHAFEFDAAIASFEQARGEGQVSEQDSITFLRTLFIAHETLAKKQGMLYIPQMLNAWMKNATVQHCLDVATQKTAHLIESHSKNPDFQATAEDISLLETVSIIHYTYGNYSNAALSFRCLVAYANDLSKKAEYIQHLSTCLALAGNYKEALAIDPENVTAWERLYPTDRGAFKARAKRLSRDAQSINRICLPYWPMRFVKHRDSEICIAELKQAAICGHDPMVFDAEFVYAGNRGNYRHAHPEKSIPAEHDTAIVVLSTNANNYYHRLIEFGARILAAAPHLSPDWPIYVATDKLGPYTELLARLEIAHPLVSFSVRESKLFDTLYVVDVSTPGHVLPTPPNLWDCYLSQPASIVRLREQLLKTAGLDADSQNPNAFVYVRRLGTLRAFEDDESQVEPFLEAWATEQGMDFVIFDGLRPFEAQLKLFAQARLIFGIHGAGLSNLIFAPSSCVVVEMPNHHNSNTLFQELSAMMGRRHLMTETSCDYQGTILVDDSLFQDIEKTLNQAISGA